MANLFSRKVQPDQIENMTYSRLKYWNKFHELMAKEELKAAQNMKVK